MVHLWLPRAHVEAFVSGSMEVEEGWGNAVGPSWQVQCRWQTYCTDFL